MDREILIFVIAGFAAQMIDGCMGMAYGVSLNTFLLSLGIPPAPASATIHTAEIFTTAASGMSHFKLGNVDKHLFRKLLVPGVIGGIAGAFFISLVDSAVIKPIVAFYLVVMGLRILVKALKEIEIKKVEGKLFPLGFAGGLMDAIGGGGWGPIVTSTLVAKGNHPRFTIGSVNAAEFFVTVAEATTFVTVMGLARWRMIAGLIIGGVIASPFAAYTCKKLPHRTVMLIVGTLITVLSVRTIFMAL